VNVDKPEETKQLILKFYESFTGKHPRNRVVKIRALLFVEEEEFEAKLLEFLIDGLRSGLPSLFNCLSVFYENLEKVT
jgi:hypothetical protein